MAWHRHVTHLGVCFLGGGFDVQQFQNAVITLKAENVMGVQYVVILVYARGSTGWLRSSNCVPVGWCLVLAVLRLLMLPTMLRLLLVLVLLGVVRRGRVIPCLAGRV